MQKLINLPSPTMTVNNLSAFYDHIKTSFRGLESLEQNHESYGALLESIIFRKLSTDLRHKLVTQSDK